MTKALVLTLGHNSSAIYIVNGIIVCGYEEERLSGIKSDSAFPSKAIDKIRTQYNVDKFDAVFVGHWFTAGQLVESKYYNYNYILRLVNNDANRVYSILPGEFTHHDSHIEAAEVFANYYSLNPYETPKTLGLVVDGFGTYGENISFYGYIDGERVTLFRAFDHLNSLGLFYQYATLYMGMKMHNHEYKMLGYEAHINEVLDNAKIDWLDKMVNVDAKARVHRLQSKVMNSDTDPLVNIEALAETQKFVFQSLDIVKSGFADIVQGDEFKLRVILSYYVQSVLEQVVLEMIEHVRKFYEFDNIILSGGTFYNVKLNSKIQKIVAEKTCIYPLAGDQGAGLGVYNYYTKDLQWPGHVNWGQRNFVSEDMDKILDYNDKAVVPICFIDSSVYSPNELCEAVSAEIEKFGFVNIVRNNMEFGPRALCQTSTISKATMENVKIINQLNDRTFVMPMAPFMSEASFKAYANGDLVEHYTGSLEYMITACDFNDTVTTGGLEGALHTYGDGTKTFRPQIVYEPWLSKLADKFGLLINTSFNNHGQPIVYSAENIIAAHDHMVSNLKNSDAKSVSTIIIL